MEGKAEYKIEFDSDNSDLCSCNGTGFVDFVSNQSAPVRTCGSATAAGLRAMS
jgi:hypothetical protein